MSKHKDEEVKLPWHKRLKGWQYLLLNIGAMIVVGILLLWGAMGLLSIYTRHNGSFMMPDIKGMTQEDAIARLKKDHLYMEIADSVYVAGEVPGIILETTPKAGTLIKSRRTIYVTVNTMNIKTIALPQFEEQSARSVEMILKGAGFTNIVKEYVPGPHDQLVLHIKDQTGKYLMAGDRIPYTTQLIMEVASTEAYQAMMLDSLVVSSMDSLYSAPASPQEIGGDGENWF